MFNQPFNQFPVPAFDSAIENWKSDAEVSIEVPRDLVSPTFTDISTEHIKNEDADEPDQFDYGFSIELNDADTAQPLTVRLQYTTVDGDDWTDVNSQGNTINTLTYDGDTDTKTTITGKDVADSKVITFDENKFDYGDVAILIQDIYKTLELEVPPRRERTFIQHLQLLRQAAML